MNQTTDAPLMVTHGDVYLGWQLGAGDGSHPTNPIRATLATDKLIERLGANVKVVEPQTEADRPGDLIELQKAATQEHIDNVLEHHTSGEWQGVRPNNAAAAFAMFGGTVRLVQALLANEIKVGFNPQGAKHHARAAWGAGFCEFNDMAWAARELQAAGLKVLYLDWDIHAGDGVYHELKGTGIPVLNIHNGRNYPGDSEMQDSARDDRYELHHPEAHAYNWCVARTDGDEAFKWAMDAAAQVIDAYAPDVILLAAGADGHAGPNNLSASNTYSYEGFEYAADVVAALAAKHCQGRVLIGGAGGYQPLDHTPEIWARVVQRIYEASAPAEVSLENRP